MNAARVVVRVVVHGAIVTLPLAALGLSTELAQPRALACIALLLLLGEAENAARRAPDPSSARAPGTALALLSALGLLATGWVALAFPAVRWWSWLGAPVVLAGIALRVAAIRALGASFTSEIVAAPGHALVTHGVYARVRHPSDLGLLLVALGLACLTASAAAAFVALATVVPSVLLRVAAEERALATRHVEAHAAYRRTVRIL
ncbi:MAG: isoprenylcysteine carboxylmethyltransferase family protein [Labilithrix sp.]|nr:isoprenylcysteine carboxylmethyltransferase family protein [Labilithrix sp.]